MRIFVCLCLLVVLVRCASAPAPALQVGPSAWRQCVDLMDRADYQEAVYMTSIGLSYESRSIEERWAPCAGLSKASPAVETPDPDPHDRADTLLSIILLNQVAGPRR
jgi:hypothetical protein